LQEIAKSAPQARESVCLNSTTDQVRVRTKHLLDRKMRYSLLLMIAARLTLGAEPSSAQGFFRRAEVDSLGDMRITLADNRIIRPPKDSTQTAVEQIALSADHQVVGWVILYPNCCTTYPIPLKLVLLRAGGARTVISNGLPIWRWAFAPGGRSVVIRQAPVHGDSPTSYEQRDIRSGRVIATAVSSSTGALPEWAHAVMQRPTVSPTISPRRMHGNE
jgi:hypothetical protein